MALLTTLVILFALTSLSFLFYRSVFATYAVSRNFADRVALHNLSLSGIYLAVSTLVEDRHESGYDSLHEDWALLGEKKTIFPEKEAKTTVHIVDLNSRLSVNNLVNPQGTGINPQYATFFYHLLNNAPFDVDSLTAAKIVAAIVDWQDKNDGDAVTSFHGQLGAESSYYDSLTPPVSCKNEPIETIDELLLIRGVSRKLLYGEKGKPGLAEYIAVTPPVFDVQPPVNINTASREVLMAIFSNASPAAIDNMIAYRDDNPFQLEKINWYSTFIPATALPNRSLIDIRSNLFEIKAAAAKGAMKTEIFTTVLREPERISFYGWRQR